MKKTGKNAGTVANAAKTASTIVGGPDLYKAGAIPMAIAMPIGFAAVQIVPAIALCEGGNHSAARVVGALRRNGCANPVITCPKASTGNFPFCGA